MSICWTHGPEAIARSQLLAALAILIQSMAGMGNIEVDVVNLGASDA